MSIEVDKVIAEVLGDKLETEPDCHTLSDLCPFMHDDLYEEPPCETCEHWHIPPPRAYSTDDSAALEGIKALYAKCHLSGQHEWNLNGKHMLLLYCEDIEIADSGWQDSLAAAFADAVTEKYCVKMPQKRFVDCSPYGIGPQCRAKKCRYMKPRIKPALKEILKKSIK